MWGWGGKLVLLKWMNTDGWIWPHFAQMYTENTLNDCPIAHEVEQSIKI